MDAEVKFRAHQSDIDRWRIAAGGRTLSAWLRDLANREVRSQGPGSGVAPPPAVVLSSQTVAASESPTGIPANSQKPPDLPTCRHGLHNCRVCGIGAFARG